MKALLKIILSVLAILLLIMVVLFLFFLPEPSPDVRVVSISEKAIKDDIDITASIISEHQYTLYSPIDGVISNFQAHLGDEVYKNQTLAKVIKEEDKTPTDSQTETRLRNQVKQYSLSIQQSNEELNRIQNAVNAGVLPRYKLEEVRSKLERSSIQHIAAQNELNSYQRDNRRKRAYIKKRTVIKALSDGIIDKTVAINGQWVRRGDEILGIVSTEDLIIKAMMSPQQVNKLVLGQNVLISKQKSKITWNEKIIRISPIISQDPTTKNLQEVTISLVNADDINKSINEKLNIKIKSSEPTNFSLSLPIDTVIREGKKFYILTIDQQQKTASFGDTYSRKGFISALQQFKCQLTHCKTSLYSLSKKYIQLGKSDLNRVQVNQDLPRDIKIIVPSVGIDENSVVILENRR